MCHAFENRLSGTFADTVALASVLRIFFFHQGDRKTCLSGTCNNWKVPNIRSV